VGESQDILVSVEPSGLALVTLNRPAKRNAVSLAMWGRLGEIFSELGAREDVRAVILTGASGHFSAGADISEFSSLRADSQSGRAYEAANEGATLALRDCRKPTIAAVSGYGMGGGCALALACDLRVGDATTRMGIPAARLGVVYGELDCSLLYRQVGLANAKRVLYSGRAFDAPECAAIGLIDILRPQPRSTRRGRWRPRSSTTRRCRLLAPSSCSERWHQDRPRHVTPRFPPLSSAP